MFAFITLVSCSDLLDTPSRDMDALIPLATGTLNIQNAIEDENIEVVEDGSIRLRYIDKLFSGQADSSLIFEKVSQTLSYSPDAAKTVSPGGNIAVLEAEMQLKTDDRIREALFREGRLEIAAVSSVNGSVTAQISITETADGNILSRELITNTGNPEDRGEISLSGVHAVLTGKNNNKVNTVHVVAALRNGGDDVLQLSGSDRCDIDLILSNLEADYIRGSITEKSFTVTQRKNLMLFKHFESGTITPEQVEAQVVTSNASGTDVLVKFPAWVAGKGGQLVALDHELMNKPLHIPRADESSKASGNVVPATYSEVINEGNSNMEDQVRILPDYFDITANITMNASGNLNPGNDFMYRERGVEVDVNLSVPVVIRAENLVFADDLEFDLGSEHREKGERIVSGNMILHARNGYPLESEIQGYMIGEEGVVIDSLFPEMQHVKPAVTDEESGRVTEPVENRFEIPLTRSRIDNLYEIERIEFKSRMNTAASPDTIPFYSNYEMNLKLIGDFKYNLDLY